jgi:hypothetical protein
MENKAEGINKIDAFAGEIKAGSIFSLFNSFHTAIRVISNRPANGHQHSGPNALGMLRIFCNKVRELDVLRSANCNPETKKMNITNPFWDCQENHLVESSATGMFPDESAFLRLQEITVPLDNFCSTFQNNYINTSLLIRRWKVGSLPGFTCDRNQRGSRAETNIL